MTKREKFAIAVTIIYIVIMAIGMLLVKSFGFNYFHPEMVKVIIFSEIIMSILVYVAYLKLKLRMLHTSFEFSLWLVPFAIILLYALGLFLFTGDFGRNSSIIILVGITMVLVGFSEELLFRGILLHVLLEKRTVVYSIIISSILFSLLHSVNILGGLPLAGMIGQLILTFLFGVIFSCLSLLIKNIIPLILYHFIWDFVIFSQSLVNAKLDWLASIAIITEVIIIVPLFIYTVIYLQRKSH
ncbi:CPBP family intramembrane glutamic endopeptidase [Staphylococcus aureus]|uniref:CPBP family intramembrane glutamic endopeptidase n=1 Tax=Staphylococcus aureus TaxID=1280 RepID=UPI002381B823|nr:CPBP family intramembrane glutamic endopeptidase [Staphylococcus aureus]MDE5043939.1 CPBP family intramembrane metalloprotease [Staphylococcus aureus]MEB7458339.1 CPBP family intramembrane metalloprotease [Staphylococcus aureus]